MSIDRDFPRVARNTGPRYVPTRKDWGGAEEPGGGMRERVPVSGISRITDSGLGTRLDLTPDSVKEQNKEIRKAVRRGDYSRATVQASTTIGPRDMPPNAHKAVTLRAPTNQRREFFRMGAGDQWTRLPKNNIYRRIFEQSEIPVFVMNDEAAVETSHRPGSPAVRIVATDDGPVLAVDAAAARPEKIKPSRLIESQSPTFEPQYFDRITEEVLPPDYVGRTDEGGLSGSKFPTRDERTIQGVAGPGGGSMTPEQFMDVYEQDAMPRTLPDNFDLADEGQGVGRAKWHAGLSEKDARDRALKKMKKEARSRTSLTAEFADPVNPAQLQYEISLLNRMFKNSPELQEEIYNLKPGTGRASLDLREARSIFMETGTVTTPDGKQWEGSNAYARVVGDTLDELEATPGLTGVLSMDDPMARGAREAIAIQSKMPGESVSRNRFLYAKRREFLQKYDEVGPPVPESMKGSVWRGAVFEDDNGVLRFKSRIEAIEESRNHKMERFHLDPDGSRTETYHTRQARDIEAAPFDPRRKTYRRPGGPGGQHLIMMGDSDEWDDGFTDVYGRNEELRGQRATGQSASRQYTEAPRPTQGPRELWSEQARNRIATGKVPNPRQNPMLQPRRKEIAVPGNATGGPIRARRATSDRVPRESFEIREQMRQRATATRARPMPMGFGGGSLLSGLGLSAVVGGGAFALGRALRGEQYA